MRVLLIHQNFPGQYKHLGPALAARGDQVVALTPKVKKSAMWNGVRILPYGIRRSSSGMRIHGSSILRPRSFGERPVMTRQ